MRDRLTCSSELSDLTDAGSLGSLSAGVGVNLGIEYHDVDILTGSENVIQSAEADIVSPAVAAEDPDGLLGEVVLLCQDLVFSSFLQSQAFAACFDQDLRQLAAVLRAVVHWLRGSYR